jgi:hypothetical protein
VSRRSPNVLHVGDVVRTVYSRYPVRITGFDGDRIWVRREDWAHDHYTYWNQIRR